MNRRDFLGLAGSALGLAGCRTRTPPPPEPHPESQASAGTVLDRLWAWAHPAGSYDTASRKDAWPFTDYGLPGTSRMTPAEGARHLGVPNVVFLRYNGRPSPEGLEPYARMLEPFKRVVWSINLRARRDGPPEFSWSAADEEEHRAIRALAKGRPNITGLIMDDYFRTDGERRRASGAGEVKSFNKTFEPAEFWDAIYTRELQSTSPEHVDVVDVMTIWTREAKDLPLLEEDFGTACRLFPRARKVLGCYLWDFLGEKRPIPMPLMEHQCELGLRWLRAGRIEGLCFIGTPMFDMGVEAVEWARKWIGRVGGQRL